MALVVQKYGGSSVSDVDAMRRVARRIVATRQAGNTVVVVVSAMGDTTDELLDQAAALTTDAPAREMDILLSAGERISVALLAMAVSELGVPARAYTGAQAGVLTDSKYGKASIVGVLPERVARSIQTGSVAIVAGFQGINEVEDTTTLGRGGSDTTAVALAAALNADVCEIYTDVDGLFTADPRIVPTAKRIESLSSEETLELAAHGAKILHLRCVEYARRENVKVHVRSSFSDKPGTWVKPHDEVRKAGKMEEAIITGVAHDRSEAKITVIGVPDQVGAAASIFEVISDAGINIDMIVQNVSRLSDVKTDISFTLPMSDGRKGIEALEANKNKIGFEEVLYDDQIGKVSIVGVGMRSHSGVTTTFFKALAAEGVNLQMISTSEIRISVVVSTDEVDRAVRGAHAAFGLDGEEEAVVYAGTGR